MRKTVCKKILIAMLMLFFTVEVFAVDKTATIDSAISKFARQITEQISVKDDIAVVGFSTETFNLSKYISGEIEKLLVKEDKQNVLVRSKSDMVTLNEEIDYQLSGEVDDNEIVHVGHQLGAEYLVTGAVSKIANEYSFAIKVFEVSTAKIKISESIKLQLDKKLQELLKQEGKLSSPDDYFTRIKFYKKQLITIEQRRKTEEVQREKDLRTANIKAIQIIDNRNPDERKWIKYTLEKFEEIKKEDKQKEEKKLKTDLDNLRIEMDATYDAQKKEILNKINELETTLNVETFDYGSLDVVMGKWDRQKQCWIADVSSGSESSMEFNESFSIVIRKGEDIDTKIDKIEKAREDGGFTAKVEVKIKSIEADVYHIVVNKVTITGKNFVETFYSDKIVKTVSFKNDEMNLSDKDIKSNQIQTTEQIKTVPVAKPIKSSSPKTELEVENPKENKKVEQRARTAMVIGIVGVSFNNANSGLDFVPCSITWGFLRNMFIGLELDPVNVFFADDSFFETSLLGTIGLNYTLCKWLNLYCLAGGGGSLLYAYGFTGKLRGAVGSDFIIGNMIINLEYAIDFNFATDLYDSISLGLGFYL